MLGDNLLDNSKRDCTNALTCKEQALLFRLLEGLSVTVRPLRRYECYVYDTKSWNKPSAPAPRDSELGLHLQID